MGQLIMYLDQIIDAGVSDPKEIANAALDVVPDAVFADEMISFLRQAARNRIHARMNNNPINNHGKTRADRIREYATKFLKNPVHGSDGWKPLGDCTVEDLLYAASIRRQKAAQTTREAEKYERLASTLSYSGVLTVDQLSIDKLVEAFEEDQSLAKVPA